MQISELPPSLMQAVCSQPLPRTFYARSAVDVAPDLLDCVLVRVTSEGVTAGRISETEAYTMDDPASHSYRGRTARNQVMFEGAGRAYIYFTYGMHNCLNAVTGGDATGEAVLIRALQPVCGTELMRSRRGLSVETEPKSDRSHIREGRALGAGPARLCQSLGLTTLQNGYDLTVAGDLWVVPPDPALFAGIGTERIVVSSSRIGITRGIDLQRRFTLAGDPFTSRTIRV